ncbi:glycoside hydrolase family 3 N-terminal domain-containing protein [Dactylosporangium sp. AC04546]|uniref:glycoside hydrolase family 3 protein n=1 Tax=Dactylosporangium sp. AC04546 TaxID=2862460 RepID=UPI001EDCF2C7|nr:glycoside hydrolase family 3 protein [Dactylosporangium sp. AC04546]WVK86282.1 glycoside hydrolase family 3 N-terminal domain-containing protein [Dactylosporangium sp. AC04546]
MRFRRFVAFSAALVTVLAGWPAPASADPVPNMTLEEKVGQLFVTYVYGASASSTEAADVAANQAAFGVSTGAEAVARYHLGGVIYFSWSRNLGTPAQIAELSNGLQGAASVPLLISTDQEGGVVNRIGAPLAVSPGNMAVGATFDPLTATRVARVSGTELRALGINMVDAPVVDVNTNPRNTADGPRAFGDRTAHVALFGAAAAAGYRLAGIGAQAKHFPGLGDTTVNTDNGVAVTNESRAEILATHVPPFQAAIAAGVPSIMTAHIVAPSLDPSGRPASLSKPIVTGLLRDRLHFDGVVITDALDAAALAGLTTEQIVLQALDAGVDQLLMPRNLPAAYQAVLDAVRNGTLSEARIDRSVRRILRMKRDLDLWQHRYVPAPVVGTPSALSTMADAAAGSITALRTGAPLPLRSGTVLVTGWGVSTTQTLTTALTARGLAATRLYTGSPSDALIAQAVAAASTADATVVTTYNAWSDPTQQRLVAALLATGRPVVVASVGGPYDIAYFPAAPVYLAAYGYQPPSLNALADVLTGAAPAKGRLPVTIRTQDGATVLFPFGSSVHSG